MEQLIERCAGIDVHQAELRVCVRLPGSGSTPSPAVVELIESYGTTVSRHGIPCSLSFPVT